MALSGRPQILKFGGTSLADASRIREAAAVVRTESAPRVVVVSALAGVTDLLMDFAARIAEGVGGTDDLLEELRTRHRGVLEELCGAGPERDGVAAELDEVLDRVRRSRDRDRIPAAELVDEISAAGEDLSARLVRLALQQADVPARRVDARRVIRTDGRFGRARPLEPEIRKLAGTILLPLLEDGDVPVVQGFVGATEDGRTTTLGRGGSDYSAAVLGAALEAEAVHVWTDVDGLLSGDPRAVDDPRILEEIGFEEAVELSYFGASVIHPSAAKHAVSRAVDLHIHNTFAPDGTGTRILSARRGPAGIAAVAFKPDVALIKVRSRPSALPYGFLARVFEILARHRLPVDLVATSHSSTAFTIDENEELERASEELSDFSEVEIVRDLVTVTVVGRGLMERPGIDALVFWAVEKTPVHLISQASDVSLSFVVARDDAPPLVRKLHATLIELDRGRGADGEVADEADVDQESGRAALAEEGRP